MISYKVARTLPYPAEFLFGLVTDIQAYPLYMPGWRAVRVLHRTPERANVEQIISLAGLRIRFVSTTDIEPPHRLEIRTCETPFQCFRLLWRFSPDAAGGTVVEATLHLAFRSPTLERFAGLAMPVVLNRVIAAFQRRAAQCYRPTTAAFPEPRTDGT